jgi:hypothetical protein
MLLANQAIIATAKAAMGYEFLTSVTAPQRRGDAWAADA